MAHFGGPFAFLDSLDAPGWVRTSPVVAVERQPAAEVQPRTSASAAVERRPAEEAAVP